MAVVLQGQAEGVAESDTAPVDLLRGSFLHCPAPGSAPPPGFGQADSFHDLAAGSGAAACPHQETVTLTTGQQGHRVVLASRLEGVMVSPLPASRSVYFVLRLDTISLACDDVEPHW